MKINFTKKEYRMLVELLYLGQWMMDAHNTGEQQSTANYEELVNKVYALAKEMGCEDWFEKPVFSESYCPNARFEEESCAHRMIDQYNDDNFWEELINRLATRDAEETAKAKNQPMNSREDYWRMLEPHETRYADEFEANGLKRLRLSGKPQA